MGPFTPVGGAHSHRRSDPSDPRQGAHLRDILSTELGPYDACRISLEGSNVFLSPKIALTMALLFHELATNAAKYGAMSTPAGCLSVSWSLLSGKLSLTWRESNGPLVRPPSHRGFGTTLVSRALNQIGGNAVIDFEPSGVNCTMNVALGQIAPKRCSKARSASGLFEPVCSWPEHEATVRRCFDS